MPVQCAEADRRGRVKGERAAGSEQNPGARGHSSSTRGVWEQSCLLLTGGARAEPLLDSEWQHQGLLVLCSGSLLTFNGPRGSAGRQAGQQLRPPSLAPHPGARSCCPLPLALPSPSCAEANSPDLWAAGGA